MISKVLADLDWKGGASLISNYVECRSANISTTLLIIDVQQSLNICPSCQRMAWQWPSSAHSHVWHTSTLLSHDTLIIHLFSLDILKHEQPDAWLVFELLVLSNLRSFVWWNLWWNKYKMQDSRGLLRCLRGFLVNEKYIAGEIWDSLQILKITHKPPARYSVTTCFLSCCSPVSARKSLQVHLPHKFWFGFVPGGLRRYLRPWKEAE